jgi:hypothetical protein
MRRKNTEEVVPEVDLWDNDTKVVVTGPPPPSLPPFINRRGTVDDMVDEVDSQRHLLDDGMRQAEGTDDRFSTVDNMLRQVEGGLLDDGMRQTEGTDDCFSTVDNMLRAVEEQGSGHTSNPRVERQSISSHAPGGLLGDDVHQTEGTDDRRSTVDAVLPAVEGQGPEKKKKKRRRKKKSVKPEPEAVAPASPTMQANDSKAEHQPPIVQQASLY